MGRSAFHFEYSEHILSLSYLGHHLWYDLALGENERKNTMCMQKADFLVLVMAGVCVPKRSPYQTLAAG